MPRFHFTRRAHNASYSDRTAKVGRPVEGIRAAVLKAFEHRSREGVSSLTIRDETGAEVGEVSGWIDMGRGGFASDDTLRKHKPRARDSITLAPDLMRELLGTTD